MPAKRTVIIYRDELLGSSETFIRTQGESLRRFRPFYLGLRHLPGLIIPESRLHIVAGDRLRGRLERGRFKLCGPSLSLRRMLASLHPALVHAHFGPDACNAILLAGTLHLPLVTTFHGYDMTISDRYLPYLYHWRKGRLKKAGAKFLCVSNFLRERALAKGFPASKTLVHYTGIDTEVFTAEAGIERSPIVLFVGRLVPKKGCTYVIQAMAEVQAALPESRLIVLGDGPLRPALELEAASLLKNCEFLGMQAPAVVKHWMNRAMIFCVPSLTAESGDAEGFGMVFAEAQAMGLPVASFASGGIPEAVSHGRTGFLVAEKDGRALAACILRLLLDRELWSGFSEAGRIRVKSLFNLKKQAVVLEQIYEDVLRENAGTSFPLSIPRTEIAAEPPRSRPRRAATPSR